MSSSALKTTVTAPALTGCLQPIDKDALAALSAKGKEDPTVIKTLKCRTVAKGRFRHLNFIRTLPAYVVDEPPGLLGDDTAPNPSEAALAALGSCLAVGIHANAVAQGITIFKLEIALEGDLNITAVWGTGDLSEKPVGFTDVRAAVTLEADRPREELEALIAHARVWSPVANTFTRPVNLEMALA
ncbi:OsmC family protein [Methylobacterium nonmethylotrophicum]|uniref:OsmC family peroxiredoxin n=1 Tax=Methylobacterium nonmethylotrophicum TaxID=1141884 RepID=A0A4Z0NVL2_9HYPH|nr:OsmC family protein [Methylobacterium nonmethylotrophicum]TGE01722.1 OsmC family peroxiredoxin [Methylobacterium nonmethylotrophicum]